MVKIISDSTCDLSPELVNRYDIDILPLHILLGEKEYKDGKNITRMKSLHGQMHIRQHPKLRHHLWWMR